MSSSPQAVSTDVETLATTAVANALGDALKEARNRLAEQEAVISGQWRFSHRGARFVVSFSEAGFSRVSLRLRADLGWMPYTAEDAGARHEASRLLSRFRAEGGEDWHVSATGRVELACETLVNSEQVRNSPLETLVRLMLALSQRIDMLAHLLRPAGEGCPESDQSCGEAAA